MAENTPDDTDGSVPSADGDPGVAREIPATPDVGASAPAPQVRRPYLPPLIGSPAQEEDAGAGGSPFDEAPNAEGPFEEPPRIIATPPAVLGEHRDEQAASRTADQAERQRHPSQAGSDDNWWTSAVGEPAPFPVAEQPPDAAPRPTKPHRPLYEYPIYEQQTPIYEQQAFEPRDAYRMTQPRRRKWPLALLAFSAGLIGAVLSVGVLYLLGEIGNDPVVATAPTTTVERVRTEIVTADATPSPAAAVARKVVPSIVTVEVGSDGGAGSFAAFASGSGVVWAADGTIITNHHVIEDTVDTRVIFQDGRIYSAAVVGSDSLTDLAVLRIEASKLVPIEIGSTEGLVIGDPAIAVGNPLGLEGGASLTVGVVSAFNREVTVAPGESLFGMLQTDAPITQGSSGGALVNGNGELIGITSAIGVSSAGAEGIGFAIPVELVTRIADEIIETGAVRHAFLGVRGQDSLDEAIDGAFAPNGALIIGFEGTPSAAEAAGLEAGDLIVRFDTQEVRTMQDLVNGIRRYRVGDAVEFEILRDGDSVVADVILGTRPGDL